MDLEIFTNDSAGLGQKLSRTMWAKTSAVEFSNSVDHAISDLLWPEHLRAQVAAVRVQPTGPLVRNPSKIVETLKIRERADLKFNIDFFNVLNNLNNPTSVTSDGLLSVRNSGSAARVARLSLHLAW